MKDQMIHGAVMLLCAVLAGCTPLSAQNPIGDMPEWVLDGTDLVAVGDVALQALPQDPAGRYEAEQGGSELAMSIAPGPAGDWTVERVHQEPGGPKSAKSYAAVRQGDDLVSADGGLTVRGAEAGILVLERASETDAIPAEYWILYYPAE